MNSPLIADLVGRMLLSMSYAVHRSSNESEIIGVSLIFDDGLIFTIRCDGSGVGLKFSDEVVEEVDIGEYGSVEMESSPLMGRDYIVKIEVSKLGSNLSAIKLYLKSGRALFFGNVDDNLILDEHIFDKSSMMGFEESSVIVRSSA